MAVVVRCPDCGKRDSLPDDQAGEGTVCAACGRQFKVPGKPPSAISEPAPAVEPPPRGMRRAVVAVAAICGIGAVGAGTYYAPAIWHQLRFSQERQIAKSLDADAKNLLSIHKTAEARVRFVELSQYLASRAENDPDLKKLADDVAADLRKIDGAQASGVTDRPLVARTPVVVTAPPANPSISAAKQPATDLVAPRQGWPSQTPHDSAASALPTAPATPYPAPPPVFSGRPAAHAVPVVAADLSDEQIGHSIQRGVDFLIDQFDQKSFELRGGSQGSGKAAPRDGAHDGADVLCVYALMQCDEAITDTRLNMRGPFMVGAIDAVKAMPLNDRLGTYSHGLRATALALHNRKEDQKTLRADVAALLKVSKFGAYTYYDTVVTQGPDGSWDNSNSQYGLLGVWSAAEADIEVPGAYWGEVEKHWKNCQLTNGAWSYRMDRTDPRLTMTCAGVASLFVCHDYLDAPKFGNAVGRDPFSIPLKKGLDWLEQGDHAVQIRGQWGYSLYGVERAGLASGFKFFGTHNWYPELARDVVQAQNNNGSWGDIVNTAYALLFLSRGRHPVLMNKLRFDGFWANRPRDVANLAKYASEQVEQPLNWQVVPLKSDWTDWTDSPILYLASHVPPTLEDADVDKIRQFVLAGGMLFVQADGDSAPMSGFAAELGHRLFPKYELANVPPGHPLFDSVYKLPEHPPFKMLGNGSRILMLFSPTDISKHWQLREQRSQTGKSIYQLGINLFIYAAGRRDLRNRLDSNIIGQVSGVPSLTMKVARVEYAGAWDPEPYAWTRFARWFQSKTNYRLDVQAVAMTDLDAKTYPFAHLTGNAEYRATSSEAAAMKKYVDDGGVLLIDLTGGIGAFDQSIRSSLISIAFPNGNLTFIQATHPLLQAGASGMDDLTHFRLRPYAIAKLGNGGGNLAMFKSGKGHVIYSTLDITSGLLNTGTWGIIGYEPDTSQSLMKNALLWTMDGQKD